MNRVTEAEPGRRKQAPSGGRYSLYMVDPTYNDPEQIAARRRIWERTRQLLHKRRPHTNTSS